MSAKRTVRNIDAAFDANVIGEYRYLEQCTNYCTLNAKIEQVFLVKRRFVTPSVADP